MAAFQSHLNRTQINVTNRIFSQKLFTGTTLIRLGLKMQTRQQNVGLIQRSECIHHFLLSPGLHGQSSLAWVSDQMT